MWGSVKVETLPHIARWIVGHQRRHVPGLQSEQPQTEFDDADNGIDALLCIGFEPKPLRFER